MTQSEKKEELRECPDCNGELQYYHSSFKNGDGITRVVCKNKCKGWKVIKEIDRFKKLKKGDNNG